MQQQNTGAVEDFILLYSAVYLRIQKWKNYWNRSTFAKVTVKIKVAQFFLTHSVYSGPVWWCVGSCMAWVNERGRETLWFFCYVPVWWRIGSCMAWVNDLSSSVFLRHYSIELYRCRQVKTARGGRILEELMRGHVTKIRLLGGRMLEELMSSHMTKIRQLLMLVYIDCLVHHHHHHRHFRVGHTLKTLTNISP